ncbi:hypothetical protein GUJ93_ZPchr2169g6447 [Zizania palustris]|uniref:Glycosyltransferases n=1 Tax=Zizania palustris TaxID=103762 RepID=A0A8J5R6E9_ZIZPA|nr:hypothetical protein GUJ93_ZPchr2169g6450 [Zizania palustris]KAG8043107.1 hypothetical protein GUJ93_ZPchr2169g6447 [Zizania palustris]
MASSPSPRKNTSSSNKPPRRRPLLLQRAMLHSSLCFLVGLLIGLAPSDWPAAALLVPSDIFRVLHAAINNRTGLISTSRYSISRRRQQPQLLVVVTTTEQYSDPERRAAGLTRTAHALRLVSPPLLWLVVEAVHDEKEAPPTARLLRGTGVVHRYLTYKKQQQASSARSCREQQRNLALGHIEEHRIAGVVLFGGLADVYDLRLLHRLREIRTFGAWPVATVSAYERKVAVHGPLCDLKQQQDEIVVTGWWFHDSIVALPVVADRPPPEPEMDGFAFSSSLLWDPHRWDRFPLSEPDTSQESVKFVQRLAVDEYKQSRGMPDAACSQIMLWRIHTTLPT